MNPLTGLKGGMQIETSSPMAPLIFKCSQLTGSQQLSTLRSVDKLQYKADQFFLLQPPNLALKLRVCFVFRLGEVRFEVREKMFLVSLKQQHCCWHRKIMPLTLTF